MASTISQKASILSTLPRELRDQIWHICIASESEELYSDKRKMSFCLQDCKEARSCFPFDFFGPVRSSLGLGPAEYYALRRMNLIFTCKQILTEAASIYRRIMTFTFRSTQCLRVFSAMLGPTRSRVCVAKLMVKEHIRPCLRGNEPRLTTWRADIKENMANIAEVYYQVGTEEAKWIITNGQIAEDAFTDKYWMQSGSASEA